MNRVVPSSESTASADFTPSLVQQPLSSSFQHLWPSPPGISAFERTVLSPPCVENPPPSPSLPNEQAAAIIAEAQKQAAQIRAEAEAKAQEYIQAAIAEAKKQIQAEERAAFAQAAESLLEQWQEAERRRLQEIERITARLLVQLARRLLHEHFTQDETAIVPIVREALAALPEARQLRLVIAPLHQPTIRAAFEELRAVLNEKAHLHIEVDEQAEPLGCVVHSESGSIDARLETRLEALQQTCENLLASLDEASYES